MGKFRLKYHQYSINNLKYRIQYIIFLNYFFLFNL